MARPVLHLPEPDTWFAASAGEAAAFETVADALAAIDDELGLAPRAVSGSMSAGLSLCLG